MSNFFQGSQREIIVNSVKECNETAVYTGVPGKFQLFTLWSTDNLESYFRRLNLSVGSLFNLSIQVSIL